MILRPFLRAASAAVLLAGLGVSAFAQDAGKTDLGGQAPPPPVGLGPRAGVPGAAPGAPQGQPPKVDTISTHNGWVVQCSDVPAQNNQPAGKTCALTRTLKSDTDQGAGLLIVIRRAKAEDGKVHTLMEGHGPIGVYLPTGVAMEIDGTAIAGRMPFVRCLPQVCLAQGEMQEDTLAKFKKGKQATFYIYDRPGHGFPLKFPLQGMAEGLVDLDKQAPAK